jgi:alkylation response protein AidB-like acyl-CoA dehydrogenase
MTYLAGGGLADEFYSTAAGGLTRINVVGRLQERHEFSFPTDEWQFARESSWFGVTSPERVGGLGLTLAEMGSVFRAVGTRLFAGPLFDQAVGAPLLLADIASAEPLLRRIVEGETTAVIADPVRIFGAQERLEYRSHRLDGSADLVRFAEYADDIIAVAAGDGGPYVIVLPRGLLEIASVDSLDPCERMTKVTASEIEIPPEWIVTSGPAALQRIRDSRDIRGIMTAAEMEGNAAELLRMTTSFSMQRRQFGRPIGQFQALQHLMAQMLTGVESLRSLIVASLRQAASGGTGLRVAAMNAQLQAARVARFTAAADTRGNRLHHGDPAAPVLLAGHERVGRDRL